ncbi:hypothetical protein LCGC14_0997350 [marine sediment metagenome]|uniref:Uncharacterized protein n=1 Tax=marine sediment metagenome TaxID=412755 RepID=A0A0F9RAA3_9ZZZZ
MVIGMLKALVYKSFYVAGMPHVTHYSHQGKAQVLEWILSKLQKKWEVMIENILSCNLVGQVINGLIPFGSENKDEFKYQYRSSLEATRGVTGVVYVFRSENLIPRLKGHSNILYIGETKYDVWNRYNVEIDANNYWHVYEYIVQGYGKIYIDVYQSNNHKLTEHRFLNQYFQKHKELPPINRRG